MGVNNPFKAICLQKLNASSLININSSIILKPILADTSDKKTNRMSI